MNVSGISGETLADMEIVYRDDDHRAYVRQDGLTKIAPAPQQVSQKVEPPKELSEMVPCRVCGGTLDNPCKHIYGSSGRLVKIIKALVAERGVAGTPGEEKHGDNN